MRGNRIAAEAMGMQKALEMNKPQSWFSSHSQILTSPVADCVPHTFPVIYHLSYLSLHSSFLHSDVFSEINVKGKKGNRSYHLPKARDFSLSHLSQITDLEIRDIFIGLCIR